MTELLDVLDKYGNKTGKIIERARPMIMAQGEYFRIVDVWILNNQGELLISKRVATAKPEPSKWQPTTGCASAGDDSISAAIREVKEELGIILDPQNGEKIKTYIAWEGAIIDVWLFRQEIDINDVVLQPSETDDVLWATKGYVRKLAESDKFLSNERVPYLEELFSYMLNT